MPEEELARKDRAGISDTTLDLLLAIALLVISIIAEHYGAVWIAIVLTSLSVFLLVHQMDWPRKELEIDVPRWHVWFSVDCVCFFLFFSVFGVSSKGYFVDLPQPSNAS